MSSYRIGVSVREITPPANLIQAGRIYLWGWGHRGKPATRLRDPLWARACAISNVRQTCVVPVSLDLCALGPEFVKAMRDRIARSRGIPGQNIRWLGAVRYWELHRSVEEWCAAAGRGGGRWMKHTIPSVNHAPRAGSGQE